MFDVWYYPSEDPSDDQPSPGDWDRYELFIDPEGDEPGLSHKAIMISYSEEGWLEVQITTSSWAKWPHELPIRFWQRVIIGIFSGEV